ncbi:MAG TPA: hypothetical protein VHE11_01115 [Steroidobacteraceae bacterium]|nr:hypothetical protein [Steroidobacteraceae bacterium]
MRSKFLALAVALAGCAAVLPAHALTADGLTYTLTAFKTADPDVDNFTLTISGINGPSDTEGGRYGVFALAFNQPAGFTGATASTAGFAFHSGGLSSGGGGGCDGTGNFFCFQNTQPIAQSSLATNSTWSFGFSVSATGISTWGTDTVNNPDDFKISWDGSKSKGYGTADFKSGYDHVSENLSPGPAAAPEIDPASATAALTFLAGGLAILRGRRRRA